MIALTKEPIAEHDRKSLAANAAKQQITFAAVTFSQIVDALKVQCADFERELLAVIEDYEGYLAEAGLLEERNQWLIVPPCGTSIDDVSRFGLYYEPSSRPCKRNYRFIGLYTQKTIRYVGTVEAIAVEYYSKGRYTFTEEVGLLTDDHKKRIKSVIDATDYYDLKANPHRFYLVDSFVQTNARKTSYGGIMGLRYLDLEEMLKDKAYSPQKDYTSKELAAALEGATWE